MSPSDPLTRMLCFPFRLQPKNTLALTNTPTQYLAFKAFKWPLLTHYSMLSCDLRHTNNAFPAVFLPFVNSRPAVLKTEIQEFLSCGKCCTIWTDQHKMSTSKLVENKFGMIKRVIMTSMKALISMQIKFRCFNSPRCRFLWQTCVLFPFCLFVFNTGEC